MAILTLAFFYKKNKRLFNLTDDEIYSLSVTTAESTDKGKAIKYIKQMLEKA